tara:strand:- start:964 stop:1179 length:216 start_codon:yes stop_codon:yes gene_type:complete
MGQVKNEMMNNMEVFEGKHGEIDEFQSAVASWREWIRKKTEEDSDFTYTEEDKQNYIITYNKNYDMKFPLD